MIIKKTELDKQKQQLRHDYLEAIFKRSLDGINDLLKDGAKKGHRAVQITLSQNDIAMHARIVKEIQDAGYAVERTETLDSITVVIG